MKKLFEKYNIIKTGHFKLTSGKHSGQYINKDAIYCIPELFSLIVNKIYTNIWNTANYDDYDVITGPALAGAILAAPVALKLGKIFVYPEKAIESKLADNPNDGVIETNIMKFRRGYDKRLKGYRIWLIEDIITTGGSIEKTIEAVELCGGKVVGISVIWNRGKWHKNIPILSLINDPVRSYQPNECPYCREGRMPLQNPKE